MTQRNWDKVTERGVVWSELDVVRGGGGGVAGPRSGARPKRFGLSSEGCLVRRAGRSD